jgi:hypothetical protein
MGQHVQAKVESICIHAEPLVKEYQTAAYGTILAQLSITLEFR